MKEEYIYTTAKLLLAAGLIFAGTSRLTFAGKEFRAQVPDWGASKKGLYRSIFRHVRNTLGSALVLSTKTNQELARKVAAVFFARVLPGNLAQFMNKRSAFGEY